MPAHTTAEVRPGFADSELGARGLGSTASPRLPSEQPSLGSASTGCETPAGGSREAPGRPASLSGPPWAALLARALAGGGALFAARRGFYSLTSRDVGLGEEELPPLDRALDDNGI